ncbi:CZB domain-containing protein [Botryobacter ruber]|uniref:CZB domain-containing protein n=1 Tax=Botryobacter ruber TaxID=2171629 RepID=UPI000E0BD6D2|nr:CZB domain-containing protein [Botryobacter ruber]
MNLAQIDFQQIRIKHILFKSKVRSVLYGGNYDKTFFSSSGPINLWFTTVGLVRYNMEPELRELAKINQELHQTALQLFSLYGNGKIEQALDGMKKIDQLSDSFLKLIATLEAKYNHRAD